MFSPGLPRFLSIGSAPAPISLRVFSPDLTKPCLYRAKIAIVGWDSICLDSILLILAPIIFSPTLGGIL